MASKKPTPRDIARKTLEDTVLQGVLSVNHIQEDPYLYGQLAFNGAKNSYNEAMNSEKIREIKSALYKEKMKKGRELGVHGLPRIDDYDVSTAVIQQLEENKLKLSLKDLEEIVKNIAGNSGYNFELPKELGDYVPLELQEKMQKAAIESAEKGKKISLEDMNAVLNEEEKYALKAYKFLSEAYNRKVSLSTANYFADLNELGKEIMEKYPPKDKKE